MWINRKSISSLDLYSLYPSSKPPTGVVEILFLNTLGRRGAPTPTSSSEGLSFNNNNNNNTRVPSRGVQSGGGGALDIPPGPETFMDFRFFLGPHGFWDPPGMKKNWPPPWTNSWQRPWFLLHLTWDIQSLVCDLLGRFGSANVGGEVSLLFRREERGNGDVSKDIRLDLYLYLYFYWFLKAFFKTFVFLKKMDGLWVVCYCSCFFLIIVIVWLGKVCTVL